MGWNTFEQIPSSLYMCACAYFCIHTTHTCPCLYAHIQQRTELVPRFLWVWGGQCVSVCVGVCVCAPDTPVAGPHVHCPWPGLRPVPHPGFTCSVRCALYKPCISLLPTLPPPTPTSAFVWEQIHGPSAREEDRLVQLGLGRIHTLPVFLIPAELLYKGSVGNSLTGKWGLQARGPRTPVPSGNERLGSIRASARQGAPES